jgi:hypothetical protein
VPQRLAVPGIPRLILTNAETELDGLGHGAGLNLFIQDGMLDFLEAFTFDEPWPDDPKHYRVKPSDPGSTRDLESLNELLRAT